jgi:dissimilatory sulfite reductase (desulfoviridin) alpha/beta subunit
VDFISTRGESFTLLSLKDAVMEMGNWTSTISRLVQLQAPTLHYLEVSAMSTISPNDRTVSDPVDNVGWQKFLSNVKKPVEQQASCYVYLSWGTKKYLFEPMVG